MSISKDIEEARKKQEILKAAELKAKLDMVTMEKKPTYGRAPRKIGEMICDTGIKTGYRNETAKFVLRLDEKPGNFIAEHGDVWYVSKSRDALQAKMEQVARVTYDLKWTRYLKVKYKVEVPYRTSWSSSGSTTHLDVSEKRDKRPILGIELTWEVVEFSDGIRLPGDEDDRYMTRDVDEDGHSSKQQESVHELPPGLVVYTKEREQLLKNIREAFSNLDKKMVELFGGTPEEVAKRLDSAGGQFLLAAPKKEKKR